MSDGPDETEECRHCGVKEGDQALLLDTCIRCGNQSPVCAQCAQTHVNPKQTLCDLCTHMTSKDD